MDRFLVWPFIIKISIIYRRRIEGLYLFLPFQFPEIFNRIVVLPFFGTWLSYKIRHGGDLVVQE
jgi:hypothetical protein